jgi:hypothetical protein
MGTAQRTEAAINRWHEVVNNRDLAAARRAAADPIVVSGPKGAGRISADEFADWVARSGITMRPRSYHPITERVMVVEQDVRWPQSTGWTSVATVFRASGDRVSAALRFPDVRGALDFASMYAELAATERP